MRKVIFIYFFIIIELGYCQPAIKEEYDDKNIFPYSAPFHDGVNINAESVLGEGYSYILSSYVNMYKTTKDKGYLIKYLKNAIKIIDLKGTYLNYDENGDGNASDANPFQNYESDYGYSSSFYQNGLVLKALSEFCHLVLAEEPGLSSIPLFQQPEYAAHGFMTYGDAANFIKEHCLAHLTIIFALFSVENEDGEFMGFKQPHEERPMPLNQQSGFAVASYYIGKLLCTPTSCSNIFLEKAARIAYLFKHGNKKATCPGGSSCFVSSYSLEINLLTVNTSKNSYEWIYNGWRETECSECKHNSDLSPGYKDIIATETGIFFDEVVYEDISHGAVDMFMPLTFYNTLETGGAIIFNDLDLKRFKNTFTKNMLASIDADDCPHFNANVHGTTSMYQNEEFHSGIDIPILMYSVFSYMPFYKFDDGDGLDVYDILMKNYICWQSDPAHLAGTGLQYLGLSNIVAAQWDKECVNLTLYNRDLVYDQDFNVKNNLVIGPQLIDEHHIDTDIPYAEPSAFLDAGDLNRFVIEPGVSSNMTAGESITLLPGFTARAGSDFTASINPSACTDGKSLTLSNGSSNKFNHANLPQPIFNNIVETKPLVNLKANVDVDKELVWLQSENTQDKNQSLLITDLTGRVIRSYDHLPASVNTNDMPPACYIFCYTTINGRASQKVFIH